MRWPFACALHERAKFDDKLVLFMGDVGGGLFKLFEKDYPNRYFNLGTGEQSMVGIAAGMALSGWHPVVYTFTPFILERAFEQIKLDVVSNRAGVLLAGWQDTVHGITHQATGATKLISCIPGLTLEQPETKLELDALLAEEDLFDIPRFLLLKELKT